MYRRYSQAGNQSMSITQRNQIRIRNLIILVLFLLLSSLCIISIPALTNNREMRLTYIHRMQTECEEAVRITNTLSRNAGADSSSMLAKVRSNVYCIETLNELSVNLSGINGTLIGDALVTNIKANIDTFLNNLTTGMDTGEQVTNLQGAMNNLLETISKLN